jgi:hypothetical protein
MAQGGIASKSGVLLKGDESLAINGVNLRVKPLREAIYLLQQSRDSVNLRIRRCTDVSAANSAGNKRNKVVSPNETGDSALDSWDGTDNGSHGSRQSNNNIKKSHSSRSRLNKNPSKNILKSSGASGSANGSKTDVTLNNLSKLQPNYQSTPYGVNNSNNFGGPAGLQGQVQHLEVNLFKEKEHDSFGFSITNSRNGVIVNTVVPNGCADQAGMKSNDLLLFLNQADISGLSASEIMPKVWVGY